MGGDGWNPSPEPADSSDMGREEFFTQDISPKHMTWKCILYLHLFYMHFMLLLNEVGKS